MTIETKELKINEELKRKVEMVCRFANVKYTIINGNIKSIKNTNIAMVKPHIVKIKGIDYLIFDDCNDIFINGYKEKIKFKDFEDYIKAHQNIDKSIINVYSIELIKASSIAF